MHAVQIVECLQIYVYIIFSPKMGEVEGQQIEFSNSNALFSLHLC